MTTRKDAKNPLAPQAQPQVLQSGTVNTDHLPPQRPKKSMTKTVRPPLEGMSLTTFIYGLVALAALYLGGQSAITMGWSILGASKTSHTASAIVDGKDAMKDKIHDFAASRGSASASGSGAIPVATAGAGTLAIESRINDLAAALGMDSGDLASAIAVAVREFVPPASLSSISAQAKETPHGGVVDILLGHSASASSASAAEAAETGGGGVTGFIGKVVGMDEPPTEDA